MHSLGDKPVKMFPQVWITGAWSIGVCQYLDYGKRKGTQKLAGEYANYIVHAPTRHISKIMSADTILGITYQCICLSHVASSNLDPGFSSEKSGHKLVAVRDSLVGTVSDPEFHAMSKDIHYVSNHPSHNEWIPE